MMGQPEPSLSLREAQLSVRLEKGSDTGAEGGVTNDLTSSLPSKRTDDL